MRVMCSCDLEHVANIVLNGRGGDFFIQAEDGIRDYKVTGVQTCALPIYYFPSAALALYQLGRAGEIGIWLERLDQWFEELDEDDQREQRRDYLASLMSLLDFFSENHGELVRPRLDALLPEVRAQIGRASCRERV